MIQLLTTIVVSPSGLIGKRAKIPGLVAYHKVQNQVERHFGTDRVVHMINVCLNSVRWVRDGSYC